MVKERPMKTADIEAEWQIAPGNSGKPQLASIVPGGTLNFEHRNIAKKGRQVASTACLTAEITQRAEMWVLTSWLASSSTG